MTSTNVVLLLRSFLKTEVSNRTFKYVHQSPQFHVVSKEPHVKYESVHLNFSEVFLKCFMY